MKKRVELITRKTGILSPTLPPEEEKSIEIWGQRHKRYLKEFCLSVFQNGFVATAQSKLRQ